MREAALPGGILTRVARSHIRVGSFQVHAARQDIPALQALADHVIAHHYPDADGIPALLSAVVAAQAQLIAQWMGLGFIHGVMNTDNMAVSGETIDYGPCAFMDAYNPAQPTGMYVWAENAADLDSAFTSIASEILRLSR